jgi:hypothetical protein
VLAIATHPGPRPHGIAVEHRLPITPPSVLGQQLTTAVVPAQPKSHFCAAPQLCAAGSQPIVPVSAGAVSAGPSPPGPASTVTALVPPHAVAASATTAASTNARARSHLTTPLYRRMVRLRRMLRQGGHLAAAARALLAVACIGIGAGVGGCGKGAEKNPDGGDGSLTMFDTGISDAPATGVRAFDVVAVLRADGSTSLPPTNRFTLVQDLSALRMIAGGSGRGAVVGVTTGDGRTFRSTGGFAVGTDNTDACSGPLDVRYDSFEVTLTDSSLTGTAFGNATISCGDCSFMVPFTATLTGTRDKMLPTLRASGPPLVTPFDSFGLVASEPLPVTATAKLVADDGATIDLVPQIVSGDVPFIAAFAKPDVVLRAGLGYVVALDGLVDFAGQSDKVGPPLRLTSFVAAPIVPEDGFESVTGGVLGGAMVMTAGALPAIAGNTSLYLGTKGAPGLDAPNGRSLMVRLARQAGDTKLRFSYRLVAPQATTSVSALVRVGSEGASPGDPTYAIGDMSNGTEKLTVGGSPVFASLAAVIELPLPADATDDVLFVIAPNTIFCFPGGTPNTGILVDDVRVE